MHYTSDNNFIKGQLYFVLSHALLLLVCYYLVFVFPVSVNNCQCGYVEIKGINDTEYNVLKTAEYLKQKEWVSGYVTCQ